MTLPIRTRARAAALGVLLAAGPAAADPTPPPTLADIGAAYQKQRQAVRSFLVQYDLQSKGLAEMPVLSQHLGTAYFLNDTVTIAGKGDLRYARTVVKTTPLPPGMNAERTIVFDGKTIKEKRPMGKRGGPALVLVQAVRKENTLYFPIIYTGAVCLAAADPGEKEPGAVTARDRFPEMFKTATYAVAPDPETVDGAACVVVAAAGQQTLWLDPQKGFAVRKREVFKDGAHAYTIHAREHEQVAPDVWLPRHVTWLSIAPPSAPDNLRAKPLLETELRVRRLEANRPEHDVAFEMKIPPGTQVFDETLTGEDPTKITMKGGNESPTVGYVQPVNAADLESVISKAKEAREQDKGREGRKSRFLLLNLLLVGLGVTAFLGRKVYLGRRPTAKAVPVGGE